MSGNYIGNNPNGTDYVLVDNKTIIEKDKKIVSKDIAIIFEFVYARGYGA